MTGCIDYAPRTLVCLDGQFTEQNMTIYARNNHIRIYTISFAQTLSPEVVDALKLMANETGGFYAHAPTGAELEEIYKRIAGELKETAGVNTKVNLTFQPMEVTYNNLTSFLPAGQVLEYQYVNGISTWVDSWKTTDGTNTTLPGFPYSLNHTESWNTNHTMNLSAGNISLNQTWEATFRFRVLAPGSINLFSPGSMVTFKDSEGVTYSVPVPDTFLNSIGTLIPAEVSLATVDVKDLTYVNDTVQWTLFYDGSHRVRQIVYKNYSADNSQWTGWIEIANFNSNGPILDQIYYIPPQVGDQYGWYYFRVKAEELDVLAGPDDTETIGPILIKAGVIIICNSHVNCPV
jgi:hypothetical protein